VDDAVLRTGRDESGLAVVPRAMLNDCSVSGTLGFEKLQVKTFALQFCHRHPVVTADSFEGFA